ncbi:MAG: MBL fold metallo-hydrolase [Saprospiraceae bacterium]
MKIKFYGTRGSIPVCARNFQDFGGNTTCILITTPDNDAVSIIDAGSGIRKLGQDLIDRIEGMPKEITIGFTHFHWDHIQGFPFFKPAYNPKVKINILMMGSDWTLERLKQIMVDQMGGAFFPIDVKDMGAQFNYMIYGSKVFSQKRGISVKARQHNHPGAAYSFRIEREGKVAVFIYDIEHGEKIDPGAVELAKDADLLVHEAQYTNQELKSRKGWGHSSYDQAIEVAKRAGVKELILTHHDPEHDDNFLLKMEKKCQKIFSNCRLAREGMEIIL